MPQHVAKTFAAPVVRMFSLVDVGDIIGHHGFPKHIEVLEDAFIGEVEATVAVSAVLLGGFLPWAFLGDMPLFVTVVAEGIAASASEKRTLDWAPMLWGQWHPVFYGHCHWGVGNMSITYLFQCLYLLHPPLHSIHLHIHCKQGT